MLRVFLKLNPPVILIIESSSLFSIYVSGKVKEMTGVSLTKDQVEKLSEQDVEKYFKRYEASLSSKTSDAMVNAFLQLSCKAFTHFLPVDEGTSEGLER